MGDMLLSLEGLSITVPQGSTFFADMTIENTTGAHQIRDLMVAFGNAMDTTFNIVWKYVKRNADLPPGDSYTTFTCIAEQVGTWDVIGAVGTYDPTTDTFVIENSLTKRGELTVTTVGKVIVKELTLYK